MCLKPAMIQSVQYGDVMLKEHGRALLERRPVKLRAALTGRVTLRCQMQMCNVLALSNAVCLCRGGGQAGKAPDASPPGVCEAAEETG